MEKLNLVKPTIEREEDANEFIQEFLDNNSKIHGVGGLNNNLDKYEEWVQMVDDYSKGINLKDDHVPSSSYFVIRDNDQRIVGMIDIRHSLTDDLLERGGHIGYGVRPSERKKGYATLMLKLGLEKSKELGIDKVLLTCVKSNIGSAKVIQNNHGILENEIPDIDEEGEILQRYWINVNNALTK